MSAEFLQLPILQKLNSEADLRQLPIKRKLKSEAEIGMAPVLIGASVQALGAAPFDAPVRMLDMRECCCRTHDSVAAPGRSARRTQA
jgi:hypothetical protein